MNFRNAIAASLLAGLSITGFAGHATAANSPKNVPGPCTEPLSMPEYCDPSSGTQDPNPEGKPEHKITDFTDVPREPLYARGEHILLARQIIAGAQR